MTWSGRKSLIAGGVPNSLDMVIMLGRTLRFGGVQSTEWTVLHHTLLGALIWIKLGFGSRDLVHWIFHDLHEAYTGDIRTPVKRKIQDFATRHNMDQVDLFEELEEVLNEDIKREFGIDGMDLRSDAKQIRSQIRFVDLVCMVLEGMFFGSPGTSYLDYVPAELREKVAEAVKEVYPSREPVKQADQSG